MTGRLTELGQIESALWRELADATGDRTHEWRTPVLATVAIDPHGVARPEARTVILREADSSRQLLRIYTDARAGKVGQLERQSEAMLVFWSSRLGWQLRCRLVCEVEQEGLNVSSRWARIKLTRGAHDYLAPLAPGEPIDRQAAILAQRAHFALISACVTAIDWLELHDDGHRRAQFAAGASRWVQP